MADDAQFFFTFRIDGILFTGRSVCANKFSAAFNLRNLINARNVNVPTERTELVKLYRIGVDITQQRAFEIEAENKLNKEIEAMPSPEDVDSDQFGRYGRILYEPISGNHI